MGLTSNQRRAQARQQCRKALAAHISFRGGRLHIVYVAGQGIFAGYKSRQRHGRPLPRYNITA
ncbi:unnamed protein product [Penicillium camemberti]|uniref:Str. FM013 n=1 Tax=Penicillium camemberti (strain FM 013) TaxID=1429867 RepID=A0A0G4PWZ7_PENC3|nr:unnamed protein product [Penicillium camemberti]